MLSPNSTTPLSPKIICLLGPTASGKTDLALRLAHMIDAEIISVDSAMIYKGMDIGTAKPDSATRLQPMHHLVDIIDPSERYSAGSFVADVERIINDIHAREKRVILAGGTMMYYHALQQGIAKLPEANLAIREQVANKAADVGWAAMHAQLSQVDPECANKIDPNDAQRIARALEVFLQTGKKLSDLQKQKRPVFTKAQYHNIVLAPDDRAILHQRIAKRFDLMLEQGFMDEVQSLFDRGDLHKDLPSIRSVGYRQAWEYLQGECDLGEMRERAIIATRQLAKRQLTWLRNQWQDALWVDMNNHNKDDLFIYNLLDE